MISATVPQQRILAEMGYKLPEHSGDDKETKELTSQIERITYSDAEEASYAVLRIAVKGYPELVTAVGSRLPLPQ